MADPTPSMHTFDASHQNLDIPLRSYSSTIMVDPTTSSNRNTSYSERPSLSIRIVRPTPSLITLDDHNLISLGYKPVMSRSLPSIGLTGIALTASNVLCGIVALYGLPLTNGGPAWATWSYLIVGTMSCMVSLCLADLAAAYPTTAGAHHWVYQLAASRQKPFLTWMTGWLTVIGVVASASSVAFYFSSILGQVLYLIHRVAYTPGTLVMFHLGAILSWQLFNLLPVRGLGYISTFSGVYIVGITGAVAIMLLMFPQPVETSLIHVPFSVFLNYSGNSSALYASLSSTLMASFVFCPQDSIIRMSEETRRPERVIPKLVIVSSVINLVLGFPVVVGLNYGVLQPMKGLLDDAVPAVRVILVALDRPLAVVFMSLILASIFFTGLSRLSLATRVVYAFSRDDGLPRSSYWNYLHARRKTPQRVSWLVATACMSGILPFYWGDSNAFHWIATLSCVATNMSFVIPFWMMLTREGGLNHVSGPFTLGALSRFFYTVSIIWLLFLSAVLMLPTTFPLTHRNFNYAPAAIFGAITIAGLSWLKARYRFTGAAKEGSRAVHRIYTPSNRRSSATHSTIHNVHDYRHHSYRRSRVSPSSQSSESKHQCLEGLPIPSSTHPHARSSDFRASTATELGCMQNQGFDGSLQLHTTDNLWHLGDRRSLSPSQGTTLDSRRRSHGGQQTMGSAVTSTTLNSYQNRPLSVLDIPLCSSPEMAPNIILSSQQLSPKPCLEDAMGHPDKKNMAPFQSKDVQDTTPAIAKSTVVPEISIAPPTTISSRESQTESPRSTSASEIRIASDQKRGDLREDRYLTPKISPPIARPPNATERIFPELAHTTTTGSSSESIGYGTGSKTEPIDGDYFSIPSSWTSKPSSPPPRTLDPERAVQSIRISSPIGTPQERRNGDDIKSSHTEAASQDGKGGVVSQRLMIFSMDVDHSFGEEYRHHYPVVSTFQSMQDLSSFPAAIVTVHETTPHLSPASYRPSALSDDMASTSGLRRGEASTLTTQPQHKEKDDKHRAVSRWAQGQGKMHEWRKEKEEAKVIHELRETNLSTASMTSRASKGLSDPTRSNIGQEVRLSGPVHGQTFKPLKVLLEGDVAVDILSEGRKLEDLKNDGVLLERVDTLGARVGRP